MWSISFPLYEVSFPLLFGEQERVFIMQYISVKEAATQWGVTIQMVRRYCQKGLIPQVVQENGGWKIPEGVARPGSRIVKATEKKTSPLVNQIKYQRGKNNHFGIYEYIQVNLAYSSSRMASNRLTREQVEDLYRTNKLSGAFEPTKVDDIIEIMNHFICTKEMVDTIMESLTPELIRRYHYCLTYGTYADKKHQISVGEYRKGLHKLGISASQIHKKLVELVQTYEEKIIDLDAILDFHVRFERIHPFEDYNGRVGRLIMIKECLRHQITPFIIDDKRRGQYNKGIKCWHSDPSILRDACLKAQARFKRQIELQRLLQRTKTSSQ